MTKGNPYVALCLAVQALRRESERLRTPLVAAMGVAANVYTHQLANTLRILTDVRVRHLLADEVGLGKTVQALMVLNALRSEHPGLRALVVVPDRLVPQWRDEVLTRANTAPSADDDIDGDQYIRIAWEALLRDEDEKGAARWSLSDIDDTRYNVLVVDEIHRLRADVQDRIVRMAPAFDHVLILSATPAFQRPERHAQIFAIVEPERTAVARWDEVLSEAGAGCGISVEDDLSSWPTWATQRVVDALLNHEDVASKAVGNAPDLRISTALTHCAYRRVIRTRRIDYPGILPRRLHIPIVVEPLQVEEERQELLWRYFNRLSELSARIDVILLAKRVILSPPSLEKRLDDLRRGGHERDHLLERARPLAHRKRGDSRLDALVDLLIRVWSSNPAERVIVAAQDNPTVDYLLELVQARLPVVGPFGARVPLVAVAIRQGQAEEMLVDLAGYGNNTVTNLEAFQRGDAQLIFATEKAQVGLNLQRARVLVLYSVPWRPEEVEQWIGRLDRIGNTAAFDAKGDANTVDVYTIAQRGLVDQKIVAVLQKFGVFEESLDLDSEHVESVTRSIETAALRPATASWKALEAETEGLAATADVLEFKSLLRSWLPWNAISARALRQQVDGLLPAAPDLGKPVRREGCGPRSWERALEGMIALLERANEYNIRTNNSDVDGYKFNSLWYRFGERVGIRGGRELLSQVVFPFGANPIHERSHLNAHAYISRRERIESPPRRSVAITSGGEVSRRPLHFLNFGDPLHDELVRGWIPQNSGVYSVDVGFFADHALLAKAGTGVYVLRVSRLDPSAVLTRDGLEELVMKRLVQAASTTPPERLHELLAPYRRLLKCALQADARWIRSELSTEFLLDGLRYASGGWTALDAEDICLLLNPMAHGRSGLPSSSVSAMSSSESALVTAGLERLRGADSLVAKRVWSHRFTDFERSLAVRRNVIRQEQRDAESLATLQLREAARRVDEARQRGNRSQVTRAENVAAAMSDTLSVIHALWTARENWLRESATAIRLLTPDELMTAMMRIRATR